MQLVLGLTGLPGAEIGLIKTIMRLSSSLQADWVVVDCGPCDVLLTGETSGAQRPVPPAVVVSVLPRGQSVGAGLVLQRPLRAEALIELLNAEGTRRAAGGAGVSPAAAAVAAAAARGPDSQARLLRWPPFALLQGRPAHMRLATLLSKQALSASRLSVVAARPLAECEAFMRELDAHNLLVWHSSAAGPASAAPRTPSGAHAAPRRGLLHTLREKLGIARSRA